MIFSGNVSILSTFVAKPQGKREYPGSKVVPFILVPRIISTFKMAGGRLERKLIVGRELIDDFPDPGPIEQKNIRNNGSNGSHRGSLARRFSRPNQCKITKFDLSLLN